MPFDYVILHCAAFSDDGNDRFFSYIDPDNDHQPSLDGPTNRALWKKYSNKSIIENFDDENRLTMFVNFSALTNWFGSFTDLDGVFELKRIIDACKSAKKIIIIVHGKAGDNETSWTYANLNTKDILKTGITEPLSKYLSYDKLAEWISYVLVGKKKHLLSLVMCYGARSVSGMKEDHDKISDPGLVKDSFAFRFFERLCRRNQEASYIMTARTGVVGITTSYNDPKVGKIKTMPESLTLIQLQLEEENRAMDGEIAQIKENHRENNFLSRVEDIAQRYAYARIEKNENLGSASDAIKNVSEATSIPTSDLNKIFKKAALSHQVTKKIDSIEMKSKVGKFVYIHLGGSKINVYRKYRNEGLIKNKNRNLYEYLDGKNLDEIGELVAEFDII